MNGLGEGVTTGGFEIETASKSPIISLAVSFALVPGTNAFADVCAAGDGGFVKPSKSGSAPD